MARVYISIGSNIQREAHVRSALAALKKRFGRLIISNIYESKCVGFDGEPFYNLVVGFDTELSPHGLAARLRGIEKAHHRDRRGPKFSPRTLDLDLLLYDDLVSREGGLELPRDEITRYAFVLQPLAEVAGTLRHPLTGETYADLWAAFDSPEQPLWRVDLPGKPLQP